MRRRIAVTKVDTIRGYTSRLQGVSSSFREDLLGGKAFGAEFGSGRIIKPYTKAIYEWRFKGGFCGGGKGAAGGRSEFVSRIDDSGSWQHGIKDFWGRSSGRHELRKSRSITRSVRRGRSIV